MEELYEDLSEMHELSAQIWYKNNKPFGFEVLDARFAALESRTKRAQQRILSYLNGEIEAIAELEEPRLFYTTVQDQEGEIMVRELFFTRLFTAGQFRD